jgi:hypothetical protein
MKKATHIGRRTLLGAIATGSGVVLTSACLGPTLPLPPPDAPDQIALASGETEVWEVRGRCSPGAIVLVENLETGLITGVSDDAATGDYLIRVTAKECDDAALWEIVGDNVSERTFFLIQHTVSGQATGSCR